MTQLRVSLITLGTLAPVLVVGSFYQHLTAAFQKQGCRLDQVAPDACFRGNEIAARANVVGVLGLMCAVAAIVIAVTALVRRRMRRAHAATNCFSTSFL